MDKTNTTRCKGATTSLFRKLDGRRAIVTVAIDRVEVLRPRDARYSIGVQSLIGCSCLVLMGTRPDSAIMMTVISASDGEEHHMSLVRQMISIFIKEQELFQLPVAWGVFSHHHKNGSPFNYLAERTLRVFQHIHLELQIFFCGSDAAVAAPPLLGRQTILAVRHEVELPEIYIDNRLMYPRVHSGSLALEFDRLGLRQIDHEHGDDDDDDKNEGVGGEESRAISTGSEKRGEAFLSTFACSQAHAAPPSRKKRQQVKQACQQCRQRKIKVFSLHDSKVRFGTNQCS